MNEEFDKWMSEPHSVAEISPEGVWAAAWQASRKQALAEAAAECDSLRATSAVSFETGSACADAIRALQKD